ncbi:hypothetical protein WSM22_20660 [Cytophagales bacterium WSM2-2]|nr:hypothetical protein WSM22_20660 [Cytophagales bacterium WSM2-2]
MFLILKTKGQLTQKLTIFSFVFFLFAASAFGQTHPILISTSRLNALKANSAEWTSIKNFCNTNLNTIIDPGYAGFDWKDALVNYATAYQVVLQSDPTTADKYAKKALALMKVMAHHHNYGGPTDAGGNYYDGYQFIGFGDGATKTFPLPGTPLAGTQVQALFSPMNTITKKYTTNKIQLDDFEPLLKISNTATGGADYAPATYQFLYRDGSDTFILTWTGATHPAANANYYITQPKGTSTKVANTQFTISGTNITFTTAPAATQAVFVRMIDAQYNQTGNNMGGLSAVQPDGPGYQMRTFNPALAYGIDLLYNYAGLTPALKTEFVNILNSQIEWYNQYGYENDGTLGNYFIEGLASGTMYTAYGTDGANPSSAKYKTAVTGYLKDRILKNLNLHLPGGFGPQGQYTEATFSDIITLMSLYKDVTGTDYLAQTEWTDNMIRATIHGTKPDLTTFSDEGDWSNTTYIMSGMISTYLTYLPNNTMAPYARQYLTDVNFTPKPVGATKNYKTDFPLSYLAKVSGPVYARSGWDVNAVWMSFSAGEIFIDHQDADAGHIAIQKGADYLLINSGQYNDLATEFNNTVMFDDRGAGNISVYPPGQGSWGTENVKITKYEPAAGFVFSEADYTSAYQSNIGTNNSVAAAVRQVLYIRPGFFMVHDKTKTKNANVKKIFNLNFPVTPVKNGDTYTVAGTNSALFVKSLLSADPAAVIAPITTSSDPVPAYRSYKVTKSGALEDNFFYAFEATAKSQTAMSTSAYLNNGTTEIGSVQIADSTWVGVFAKQGNLGQGTLTYNVTTGKHHDIIADLSKSSDYKVTVAVGSQKILDGVTRSTSANGVLSLAYSIPAAGIVTLEYIGAASNPPPTNPGQVTEVSKEATENSYNVWESVNKTINVAVRLVEEQKINMVLYDVNGRVIVNQTNSFITGETLLELPGTESLKPGLYIFRMIGEKSRFTATKIVVR